MKLWHARYKHVLVSLCTIHSNHLLILTFLRICLFDRAFCIVTEPNHCLIMLWYWCSELLKQACKRGLFRCWWYEMSWFKRGMMALKRSPEAIVYKKDNVAMTHNRSCVRSNPSKAIAVSISIRRFPYYEHWLFYVIVTIMANRTTHYIKWKTKNKIKTSLTQMSIVGTDKCSQNTDCL